LGQCLLQEGRAGEAADYYAQTKTKLASTSRGRATVLQLHALIEAGKDDEALKVVKEQFPRMGELLQLVTFQTLTFELGSRYLERNRPRDAIICLQRIWSADRLIEHQQILGSNPCDEYVGNKLLTKSLAFPGLGQVPDKCPIPKIPLPFSRHPCA
jgi:hypothetical protein